MKLTRVTITGADDAVSHNALDDLSREFMFLELGILHSESKRGTPRYPSLSWCEHLYDSQSVNLSAHLCGKLARDVLSGDGRYVDECVGWGYQRIQLNGFGQHVGSIGVLIHKMHSHPNVEFICQAQNSADLSLVEFMSHRASNVSALWDLSGGRGIAQNPEFMPQTEFFRIGFAGGITVSNVHDILLAFCKDPDSAHLPLWIDIETGARDEHDRFDLDRARALLERAAPFVECES